MKACSAAASVVGVALLWSLLGCSPSPEEQMREHPGLLDAPSRAAFPDVADALQHRCATLDCHGQAGRNLRLYGYGGLRLSAAENPLGDPTTDQELDASYDSLVALEPEVLSAVMLHQVDPNQLSLVRKMRGIERHKGGLQARVGDALDRCVVLWLTDAPDPTPCGVVVNQPHPTPQ